MNPQAEELNLVIKREAPAVFEMLSERGKAIFFPKKGILGQTADAKGTKINATIGAAIEDDGSIMRLASLEKLLNMNPEQAFPYAPSFGRLDLRNKWKEMMYKKNPALGNTEISLPVVTNALTHGLSMIAYMFLNEGDNVTLSDLYWGNYNLIFKNAYGADIKTYQFFRGEGFNIHSFKETIANAKPGKKVILLNFPNNPSGYTPTVEETKQIVDVLVEDANKGNKLAVINDDAYFNLVYQQGVEKQSVFAYLANAHENILAIKADGPTKEDYVLGF
ncbi:MAG: aminotransferase class I/II-fold pyridoxal phosphate-dependent enzyme [Bacteroidales bacterium]|nr:aminotransferase class I/II-fold pyridoxal phosphate-dependent enzyme [Bacteroidales bacterium]